MKSSHFVTRLIASFLVAIFTFANTVNCGNAPSFSQISRPFLTSTKPLVNSKTLLDNLERELNALVAHNPFTQLAVPIQPISNLNQTITQSFEPMDSRSELRAVSFGRREVLKLFVAGIFGLASCMPEKPATSFVFDGISVSPIPDDIPKHPRLFYERGSIRVEILDNYSETYLRFTDEEIGIIFDTLNKLPEEHLKTIQWIATRPSVYTPVGGETRLNGIIAYVHGETDGLSTKSVGARKIIFKHDVIEKKGIGDKVIFEPLTKGFAHEIGHHVHLFSSLLDETTREEWRKLYDRSLSDEKENSLYRNFVETWWFYNPEYYIERYSAYKKEMMIQYGIPYGSVNHAEDFASVYGNWVSDSEELLREAIRRAETGYPILLEKILFIISLFTDGSDLFFFKSELPEVGGLQVTKRQIELANNVLSIGEEQIIINNDLLLPDILENRFEQMPTTASKLAPNIIKKTNEGLGQPVSSKNDSMKKRAELRMGLSDTGWDLGLTGNFVIPHSVSGWSKDMMIVFEALDHLAKLQREGKLLNYPEAMKLILLLVNIVNKYQKQPKLINFISSLLHQIDNNTGESLDLFLAGLKISPRETLREFSKIATLQSFRVELPPTLDDPPTFPREGQVFDRASDLEKISMQDGFFIQITRTANGEIFVSRHAPNQLLKTTTLQPDIPIVIRKDQKKIAQGNDVLSGPEWSQLSEVEELVLDLRTETVAFGPNRAIVRAAVYVTNGTTQTLNLKLRMSEDMLNLFPDLRNMRSELRTQSVDWKQAFLNHSLIAFRQTELTNWIAYKPLEVVEWLKEQARTFNIHLSVTSSLSNVAASNNSLELERLRLTLMTLEQSLHSERLKSHLAKYANEINQAISEIYEMLEWPKDAFPDAANQSESHYGRFLTRNRDEVKNFFRLFVNSEELIDYRLLRKSIFEIYDREKAGAIFERLQDAFVNIPRHLFLPQFYNKARMWQDHPLEIGYGQTISSPSVVASMLALLNLSPSDKVLEVGSGSGWVAALLSQLAGEVYSVERIKDLKLRAERTLSKLKISNAHILRLDGSMGYKDQAPYDAIIVSAGSPKVSPELVKQLKEGGRLVLPVATGKMIRRPLSRSQKEYQVVLYIKTNGKLFQKSALPLPVSFVPLIGKTGWKSDRSELRKTPVILRNQATKNLQTADPSAPLVPQDDSEKPFIFRSELRREASASRTPLGTGRSELREDEPWIAPEYFTELQTKFLKIGFAPQTALYPASGHDRDSIQLLLELFPTLKRLVLVDPKYAELIEDESIQHEVSWFGFKKILSKKIKNQGTPSEVLIVEAERDIDRKLEIVFAGQDYFQFPSEMAAADVTWVRLPDEGGVLADHPEFWPKVIRDTKPNGFVMAGAYVTLPSGLAKEKLQPFYAYADPNDFNGAKFHGSAETAELTMENDLSVYKVSSTRRSELRFKPTSLNSKIPERFRIRIKNSADRTIAAARNYRAGVEQSIHHHLGAAKTNVRANEAVILGRHLVTENGLFAIASEVIHEFGGVGALIQTYDIEEPLVSEAYNARDAGDEIVIAQDYREAIDKLRKLGFTHFHFILAEEDASPELRKLGRVTILNDEEISGLLAKFESMIAEVRSELRLAEAA